VAELNFQFSIFNSQLGLRVAALVVVLSVCAAPAQAQRPRPDRPYRGLFGGNGADPNSAQQLDVNVSLSGAYDDNVLADRGQGGLDPRFQKSGGYGGGSVSLDYTRRAGRATFDFTGGTSYRYYPSIREMNGFNSFGSIGLSVKLTSRTDFRLTESASYSPYYSFGGFPGLAPYAPGDIAPISPDYPLLQQAAISLFSSASIEHRLTPRASLSADYLLNYVDYRGQNQPFRNWGAGGRFSYRLSSHASARLGYHYRRGTYGAYYANRPIDGHDIDVGIDYNRALSFSRTTTFGFSTGSSIYRSFSPSSTTTLADWQYRTHYMVTGNAYLNRQIGRSWNARLSYQRGLQFVQGFPDPFFSDSVTASVGGFADARSRLNFTAAYSNGAVGVAIGGRNFTTYTGVASYQLALVRWAALFADYSYYHYIFDPTVPLPPGMNRGLDRQSVRGGLNLWLPLLR
jgi:hypothetical protein